MKRGHTHPCTRCQTPVECDGRWERNYDGFPEAICTAYHLPNGRVAEITCDSEACNQENEQESER